MNEEKRYVYYVASFNNWILVRANNAKEAIALGEKSDLLRGKEILVARIATRDEREQLADHKRFERECDKEHDENYWMTVRGYLRGCHGRSIKDADAMIADFQQRHRDSGTYDLIFHYEPIYTAEDVNVSSGHLAKGNA